ncbi:integrase catalytic domain-containing protein [Trichonephila clavipes]|nr:integrase catalytic domain-containing protein [Trichonephila clavipes]
MEENYDMFSGNSLDKIIQNHLEILPIQNAIPQTLSGEFIECNMQLQALAALGEKTDNYGRVLVPKILRVLPDDIVTKWIIRAKREFLSEGNITKME